MMRQTLHSLLSIDSEMEVVAEAENGLVAVHLARKMEKLKANSVATLTKIAIRDGLTSLEVAA